MTKKIDEGQSAKLFTIEELKQMHGITDGVFYALMVSNDWASGFMITEDEFLRETEKFLKTPISGRR